MQKGAKKEHQKLEKKNNNKGENEVRRENTEYNYQIWNQAQENNVYTTFVTGCIKSSLGRHYQVKNHSRLPSFNQSP